MSVAREVEVDYDLNTLAQAAKDVGFIVQRHATARGWAGKTMQTNCDLVLTNPKNAYGLDAGFKVMPNGKTKLFADNHGEAIQRELAEKVLPRYIERMIENDKQAQRARFAVTGRNQVGRVVTINIGRV